MKGLILKDFYTTLSYGRTILFYLVIFGGFSIFTGNSSYASIMSVVLVMSITLSCFTYDEFYHWERYAAASPLSRRQIVAARYLFFLLLAAASVAVSLALMCLTRVFHPQFLIADAVAALLSAVFADITLFALVIPVIYKVGSQKARNFMILVFGLVFLLIIGLAYSPIPVFEHLGRIPLPILVPAGVLACTALIFLSFLASAAVFQKKELK